MYEVSSEIMKETDFEPTICKNGNFISKFKFIYPCENETKIDSDGDLEVERRREGIIEIEHLKSTTLALVGLQVWRGALILADFLFHIRNEICDKNILELGAGCGLTSIASGIYCEKVICTDVNIGGILDIIKSNVKRNQKLLKGDIHVMELNFKDKIFSKELEDYIDNTDIIVTADVIYDDDLTDCFIEVLDKILNKKWKKQKTIYMALEKRYVFTVTDLDVMPPCYDYFLKQTSNKMWQFENIPIYDFPQYFLYEKCKLLVLLKITNKF